MNFSFVLDIGSLTVGMVELIISCRLAGIFLEEKDVPKWKVISSFTLIGLIIFYMLTTVGASPITSIVTLTMIFILHLVLFNGPLKKRFLVSILILMISILSDFITVALFNRYRILYPQGSLAFATYWTLMGLASKVISFMAINMIYRFTKNKEKNFKFLELMLHVTPIVTIYTINLVMTSILVSPNIEVKNMVSAILASIGLLLTNVFTWSVFDALIKNERDTQLYLRYQENIKKQYEFYRNQEVKEESTRQIWHDINNHLECVKELIRNGYNKEATDYFVTLEKNIAMRRGDIHTGHLIIDTILADKYATALAYGIKMVMKVDGALAKGIQDMDLCTIYGNLLDNAIEASRKLEVGEGEILLRTEQVNQFILIEVLNSRSGEVIEKNGQFVTTKQAKVGHGIGLSSVRQVVHKYDGEVLIDYNDTTFKVQIFIPLSKTV